ncbi:MAG: hypothetical protein EXS02_11045 [Planctomycetes bacterium]|nr:hypothetical protein [Planctomycetota bacterium]
MLRRILCAALLATAAFAQAPIVTTVINSGSTLSRYDIVFLGDGYQATERARFNTDVNTCLTSMFTRQPYSTFAGYFNVHSVFRASQNSGASQPDVTPPISRVTAYGSTYNTSGVGRCLYITNEGLALADAALAPANEGRTVVLVNDNRYGGCAAQFAVSYNGTLMPEVQVHELGHALGNLADEYDYPNNIFPGGEPSQVNITANSAAPKWAHWFGTDNIGAFEGAGYYLHGLWRPRIDCLMRNLGVSLCSVCIEQIARTVNASVKAIDLPIPSATSVQVLLPAVQVFSFTNIVPTGNNPVIDWAVDGQVIPGATSTSFSIDSTTTPAGPHTVRVTVRDQSTLVRLDPTGLMRETRTWNVQVLDPSSNDLSVSMVQVSQPFVDPGQPLTISCLVSNAGPAAAPGATLELFLSRDATLQTSDIYLGSRMLPTLTAGQIVADLRTVPMPALVDISFYYLIAIVDRDNLVHESNETNNTRASVAIIQNYDCTPRLELRDDLQWPRNQGAIVMSAGGTLSPTVVARCAAGQLYVIAWTGSGTSPGTTIAQGITIPINQDPLTQLGLLIANGSLLQQFIGVLDAQGVGRATLMWPAGLLLPPTATDFAGALINGSGFSGVTNPIGVELR